MLCIGKNHLYWTKQLRKKTNFHWYFQIQVVSGAPPPSTIDDESTLSIIDEITKKLEKLKEKVVCAVAVTGNVAKGSDLEKKYLEFQAAVNTVLTKDLKECAQAEGVRGKLRQVASLSNIRISKFKQCFDHMSLTISQMLCWSFEKTSSTIQWIHERSCGGMIHMIVVVFHFCNFDQMFSDISFYRLTKKWPNKL